MDAGVFTIDELKPGMSASHSKTFTKEDVEAYGALSGDINPIHFDHAYAATTLFRGPIVHGMLSAGLISTVLGTKLPGPGCIALGVNLQFLAPVRVGDTVTATCTVREVKRERRRVTLDCECRVKDTIVLMGEALVMPVRRS
ncbi:MAG: MaoC family dehydratase [Alphaproteobacteria bacterium]